jgi:hypothetical protein
MNQKEKILKVNFDYELELNDLPKNSFGKIYNDFEFLYFFSHNTEKLFSNLEYERDYIYYLNNLLGKNIIITNKNESLNVDNWWGQLKNIDFEKQLNNKLFTQNIKNQLNIPIPKEHIYTKLTQCFTQIELKKIISKHFNLSDKTIIKASNSFSGKLTFEIDHSLYLNDLNYSSTIYNKLYKLSKHFILFSVPKLNRIIDIGFSYNFENKQHDIYQNLINQNGVYKGCHFLNSKLSTNKQLSIILESQKININKDIITNFISELESISEFIKNKSHESFFSVDSFIYQLNNDSKFFLCHEINYRRTMSMCSMFFKNLMNENSWCSFKIYKNNKKLKNFSHLINDLKSILYNKNSNKGVIPLTDTNKKFLCFCCIEDSLKKISELETKLKAIINL